MFENLTNKFEEIFSSLKKAPSLDEKQVDEGLREIKNPSSIFTNKENISGVTTTITNEGTRPLAVDIQALVNKTFYSNPRRTTTGISIN